MRQTCRHTVLLKLQQHLYTTGNTWHGLGRICDSRGRLFWKRPPSGPNVKEYGKYISSTEDPRYSLYSDQSTDWTVRASNPDRGKIFFLIQKPSRSTMGARQASCLMGTGVLPGGKATGAWKLTAHLQLVLILRMGGAVPPLPLYTFMAPSGTTLFRQQEWYKEGVTQMMGWQNRAEKRFCVISINLWCVVLRTGRNWVVLAGAARRVYRSILSLYFLFTGLI